MFCLGPAQLYEALRDKAAEQGSGSSVQAAQEL